MNENKCPKELINSHWDYISRVLQLHGVAYDSITKVEFHYKTAFEHGWKHAKEDTAEGTNRLPFNV